MTRSEAEEVLGWGDGVRRARERAAERRAEARDWARGKKLCVECGGPGVCLGTDWFCVDHLPDQERCG